MRGIWRWLRLNVFSADWRVLHGLDSGLEFALDISRAYCLSYGAVFAALVRLEVQDLVQSATDENGRRRYWLTMPGRARALNARRSYPGEWVTLNTLTEAAP